MTLNTVRQTGSPDNRVDIIVMGDGYTEAQIAGDFYDDIDALQDFMLTPRALIEPFGRYEAFFNFHAIETPSIESGADIPQGPDEVLRDTALGATYYYDGFTERLLSVDDTLTRMAMGDALAGQNIDPEIRIVMVNDTKYGGAGGYFATYSAGNTSALEVALHEIAHSFVDLADEYGGGNFIPNSEPREANVTLDSTGAKWERWLGYDDGILGPIGAYEGGRYTDVGVYRPTENSKMRILDRPFDAIAREAFVLGFYELVDPLDDYTGKYSSTFLNDPDVISLTTVDDSLYDFEWTLDGVTLSQASNTLDIDALGLAAGGYDITATVADNTDWVRLDRSSLEQTVSWYVDISYQEPLQTSLTEGDDTYTGVAGRNETIQALGGNDHITLSNGSDNVYGGAGNDTVSFINYRAAVSIDMIEGTARSNGDENILSEVENITGTIYGDYIATDEADNRIRSGGGYDWMVGSEGADYYDGSNGRDMISYINANEAVEVDLGAGRGRAGQADGDRYVEIERVTGSIYSDLFYGSEGEDEFRGAGGYDWMVGSGGGRDRYDGGVGLDTVAYTAATSGVAASLQLGRGISGDASRDLYTSIENLTGSNHDDTLTGDGGRNILRGMFGEDRLFGGGGVDRLYGGASDDMLNGGASFDFALYDGNRADYTLLQGTSGVTVRHDNGGRDGTDVLFDIEAIQFADALVYL